MASKWNDPLHNFHEHLYITDKCWLWTGCLDKHGYGIDIRTSNKSIIELSTELSVSKHCIWDALHKRSWKDVN